MPNDEQTSVSTYKGYYIGRYETGIINYTLGSNNNSSNSTNWTGYTAGTLVVQKGKQVWNYITKSKAETLSKIYNQTDHKIISKLCSSYAWDTALTFINSKTENSGYITNSIGGIYDASEIKSTGTTTAKNNIYDMGGNAWEWTTEKYEGNENQPVVGRGGSYSYSAAECPASMRSPATATNGRDYRGFRIAIFI